MRRRWRLKARPMAYYPGWIAFSDPAEVMPVNDFRLHIHGLKCWCRPTDDDCVIVHHAMDGREAYERGDRVKS
jgi:hypothetical protein